MTFFINEELIPVFSKLTWVRCMNAYLAMMQICPWWSTKRSLVVNEKFYRRGILDELRDAVLGHEGGKDERIVAGKIGCREDHLQAHYPDVRRRFEARIRRKLVNSSGASADNIKHASTIFTRIFMRCASICF